MKDIKKKTSKKYEWREKISYVVCGEVLFFQHVLHIEWIALVICFHYYIKPFCPYSRLLVIQHPAFKGDFFCPPPLRQLPSGWERGEWRETLGSYHLGKYILKKTWIIGKAWKGLLESLRQLVPTKPVGASGATGWEGTFKNNRLQQNLVNWICKMYLGLLGTALLQ